MLNDLFRLNNKEKWEMSFWQNMAFNLGADGFRNLREWDLAYKTKFFNGIFDETGRGLDCGCGPISVFEFSKNKIIAIEPLLERFREIIPFENTKNVKYLQMSGEEIQFTDNYFDYIFCVNVIDHTPNPGKMAEELFRTLKPRGKLYFEVNFDDYLSPAHYELWNENLVNKYLNKFILIKKEIERNDKDYQSLYHAIYEKP